MAYLATAQQLSRSLRDSRSLGKGSRPTHLDIHTSNHIEQYVLDEHLGFDATNNAQPLRRRSKSDDRGKKRHSRDSRSKKKSQEDVEIPPPTRKFTTTNPCTMSPTYHLFYDLTYPLTTPRGQQCPPQSTSIAARFTASIKIFKWARFLH